MQLSLCYVICGGQWYAGRKIPQHHRSTSQTEMRVIRVTTAATQPMSQIIADMDTRRTCFSCLNCEGKVSHIRDEEASIYGCHYTQVDCSNSSTNLAMFLLAWTNNNHWYFFLRPYFSQVLSISLCNIVKVELLHYFYKLEIPGLLCTYAHYIKAGTDITFITISQLLGSPSVDKIGYPQHLASI